MEMTAQQHLEKAEAIISGYDGWGEDQMLARAIAAQTHLGIATALIQQDRAATLRSAYAHGRHDESAGNPVPPEYR